MFKGRARRLGRMGASAARLVQAPAWTLKACHPPR